MISSSPIIVIMMITSPVIDGVMRECNLMLALTRLLPSFKKSVSSAGKTTRKTMLTDALLNLSRFIKYKKNLGF